MLSAYKDAGSELSFQSWRSYAVSGTTLFQVSGAFSNFHFLSSSKEKQCRIAISLVEMSPKAGGVFAEAMSIDRSKLVPIVGLGERYAYLSAKPIDATKLSREGYDCVLDASDGTLDDCNPTATANTISPTPPKQQQEPVRGYLRLFKPASWQWNEDDVVQRPVHVSFSLDPSDKVPAFDWSKAKPTKGRFKIPELISGGTPHPPITGPKNQ